MTNLMMLAKRSFAKEDKCRAVDPDPHSFSLVDPGVKN